MANCKPRAHWCNDTISKFPVQRPFSLQQGGWLWIARKRETKTLPPCACRGKSKDFLGLHIGRALCTEGVKCCAQSFQQTPAKNGAGVGLFSAA